MTEVGTELRRTASLPTVLPLQRRRSRAVEVLLPPDIEPKVVDTAILAPPESVGEPGGTAASGSRFERNLVLSADAAAGACAGIVDWRLGLLAAAVIVPATAAAGLQRRRFSLSVLDEAPRVVSAWGSVLLGLAVCAFALEIPTRQAFLAAAVTAAGLFVFRALVYGHIRAARRAGRSVRPVLLVGPTAEDLIRRVREHPETGVRVIGVADANGRVRLVEGGTSPVSTALQRYAVRDVIVDPCGDNAEIIAWVRDLTWRDLSMHMVLPQMGAAPARGWDDQVWGVPLMRMQAGLPWRRMRWAKRVTDVVVAGGALMALSPVLGLVALLVRREVGAPIIFRQQRVGMDARTFDVLKFRSMRDLPVGQESPWTVQATSSDRVGPVGRFIRKYSIDELPQLWNVVRGDMSLVGPRPERPQYVSEFSASFPHYGSRHRAPAGLTGLAAVEGLRGDTSIADRAHFDNLYVDSWTFWLDLKIVARTVAAVVRGTGS